MDELFGDEEESTYKEADNYYSHASYDAIDDPEAEITQEDAWVVISKYFEEKGLVRQQLDSFDGFISNTIQVYAYTSNSIFFSKWALYRNLSMTPVKFV